MGEFAVSLAAQSPCVVRRRDDSFDLIHFLARANQPERAARASRVESWPALGWTNKKTTRTRRLVFARPCQTETTTGKFKFACRPEEIWLRAKVFSLSPLAISRRRTSATAMSWLDERASLQSSLARLTSVSESC